MCLVAEGASEVCSYQGIHCWDVAAGAVVCREAGAVVLDTAGTAMSLCLTGRPGWAGPQGPLCRLGGSDHVSGG